MARMVSVDEAMLVRYLVFALAFAISFEGYNSHVKDLEDQEDREKT